MNVIVITCYKSATDESVHVNPHIILFEKKNDTS